MVRKNRTPEEKACRKRSCKLLQMANIGCMYHVQNLFKEIIAEFMEMAWKRNWMRSRVTAGMIIRDVNAKIKVKQMLMKD